MKISKLKKSEAIRQLLHDRYTSATHPPPFSKWVFFQYSKYADSTLARRFSHEELDETLKALEAELKPRTDSNTYRFLDRLLELSSLIATYIPEARKIQRFCEIRVFSISRRTPEMVKAYSNAELFDMIGELETIIRNWEETE